MSDSTCRRVQVLVALGWLAGLALSWPLWLARRDLPLCPLIPGLDALPPPGDVVLLLALLLGLVLLVLRGSLGATLLALGSGVVLVLQDQMRLQPWVYQALLMLVVLTAWRARRSRADTALAVLRLLMAATYLWSGVHKLNREFLEVGFPWLVAPVSSLLGASGGAVLQPLALGVALLEAGLGLGLLLARTRRAALLLAISMHLFILALIGPLGHAWNPVVWPWNLAMPALLVLLFGACRSGLRESLAACRRWLAPALLVLGLLPGLHLVGAWDAYLSFSLYSYASPSAFFALDADVVDRMPEALRRRVVLSPAGEALVLADAWSLEELGVPVYPAARVFQRLHERLCQRAGRSDSVVLVIHRRERLSGRRVRERFRCFEQTPVSTASDP